jgi:hypothetical protein
LDLAWPCDLGRWFVYLIAAFVSLLGTYAAVLVALRSRHNGGSAWRPAAYGITFTLAAYLVLFWLGWFPASEGSITGTFLRDMEVDGVPRRAPPYGVHERSLASARAAIIMCHVTT